MKATLLVLSLTFSTAIFADTKIDTPTCYKLKTAVSSKIFSRATIVGRLKIKGLENERTVGHLDTVDYNLNKDLEKYCTDNKVTIESLIKYQSKACINHCGGDKDLKTKRGLFDKDQIFSESEVVFQVCNSLCEEGAEKLKIFKMGADINPKDKSNTSPDCTGAVSDKGRGIEVKAIEVNVDTGKTTIKTTGK